MFRRDAPESAVDVLPRAINICLINSRPRHPQANGRLERFHKSVGDEMQSHDGLDCHIEHCADLLHWALYTDNYESPMVAFRDKAAADWVSGKNPKWMEAGIND